MTQKVKIGRVFVECSHTASTGLNTGIQRVVRKIIDKWGGKFPDGTPVHLLSYDGVNCYEIAQLPDNRHKKATADTTESSLSRFKSNFLSHTTQFFESGRNRLQKVRVTLASYLPRESALRKFILAPRTQLGLARFVYVILTKPLLALKSRISASQSEESAAMPVEFREDDVLLMLDSSWHYSISALSKHARSANATVITVIYDLIPILHPELCEVELTDVFESWVEEAASVADGFIAISKTVKSDIERYNQKFELVNKPEYGYFYLGAEISNTQGSVRAELKNVIHKTTSYLIVCTVEPRKNHKYLFETFKKLWDDGLEVNLHIVGRVGWKVDSLLKEIKQHPEFGRRIFLWHDLNDSELVYCYKHAKALLFPSVIEGFGLPLIEAQHYGLPVLASDTPIHREIGQGSVDYFDISRLESLYNILTAIENNETQLPVSDPTLLKSYTWKNSATTLAEQVIEINNRVKTRQPEYPATG